MRTYVQTGILVLTLATSVLAGDYAVVVSQATRANKDWRPVVQVLIEARAKLITHKGDVAEALGKLRGQFPRYTCFVATPKEATGAYVAQAHQLTRQLDEDPYTDILGHPHRLQRFQCAGDCEAQQAVDGPQGGVRHGDRAGVRDGGVVVRRVGEE